MPDPALLTLGGAVIGSVSLLALVVLRGWQGWLELRRAELEQGLKRRASPVADLRQRVRRLEAIANGG